jgi:hypothetical protein
LRKPQSDGGNSLLISLKLRRPAKLEISRFVRKHASLPRRFRALGPFAEVSAFDGDTGETPRTGVVRS